MMTSTSAQDRRQHRRFPSVREVAVFRFMDEHDRPQLARGRVSDISSSGAAIREAAGAPPAGVCGQVTIYFNGFEIVSDASVTRSWNNGFALHFAESVPDPAEYVQE